MKVWLLLLAVLGCWAQTPAADKVTELDGYLSFTGLFEMYSGYLPISEKQKVHYIFVTSMTNQSNDDVVLWLNGGPGCSSLLGFATQIGPNILNSGDKNFARSLNPYAWNKQANLLFLQSPPGVGFSTNDDPTYVYNESSMASDTSAAIKLWFDRFPTYKSNNFWISGESYCGMYIPNIAHYMLQNKLISKVGGSINLKGLLIGNGVMLTDKYWRRKARNAFYSRHYFYGPQIDRLISFCTYTQSDELSPACKLGNTLADKAVDQINPYATTSICYASSSEAFAKTNRKRRRFYRAPFFEQNNPYVNAQSLSTSGSPCTDDDGITAFFNKATVKKQLHVDPNIQWASCNENIGDNYHKDQTSIQYFNSFKTAGLKILLYSGNTDAVVSYVETEEYVRQIGWNIIKQKTPFNNDRKSLQGWTTEYDGLTVAIINGAGHMVPADKPNAAFTMFQEFINRK